MKPIGILIIAHAPLASALRSCAMHMYAEFASSVVAVDVLADASVEESTQIAGRAMQSLGCDRVLVLTDLYQSTPSSIARSLIDGQNSRLVAGVNFSMLLRALPLFERERQLDDLVTRVVEGAKSGISMVSPSSAPQNQPRQSALNPHDQQHRHQQ